MNYLSEFSTHTAESIRRKIAVDKLDGALVAGAVRRGLGRRAIR
jgi:hypothetical protein